MDGKDGPLFPRFAVAAIKESLEDTPVVMVIGPRQSGKTTLVRNLALGRQRYITLDDETQLRAAMTDPVGYVRELDRAVIDEVQHVPELLRAIKKTVDEDRRPGRFLLTGSADVLTLPKVSESLAGRMSIVRLLPLSQAEINRAARPRFLDLAFQGEPPREGVPLVGSELVDAVLAGGYPEMVNRGSHRRRAAWARDYVEAIIQRDVRTIADVERSDRMPVLLRALAAHSAQLTNLNAMAGAASVDHKTAAKYVGILEQLYLVHRLPAWSNNRLKRLVKAPKVHFLDSGLLAMQLGITPESIASDRTRLGPLLETFIFGEVLKQVHWEGQDISLHHYRDKDHCEVDIVAENAAGELLGIEVKAAASVKGADFKGLRRLAEATKHRFRLGVVLYDGDAVVPFGDKLFAVPASYLWT
jgi:hypothetical protein